MRTVDWAQRSRLLWSHWHLCEAPAAKGLRECVYEEDWLQTTRLFSIIGCTRTCVRKAECTRTPEDCLLSIELIGQFSNFFNAIMAAVRPVNTRQTIQL